MTISEGEHRFLEEAVGHGAALLDERLENWFHHIQISSLTMQLCTRCILGQLYGDFVQGFESLQLSPEAVGLHGFDLESDMLHSTDNVDDLWQLLDALWTDEVKRRLAS